jgi:ASC-1-like (ASCH) protein
VAQRRSTFGPLRKRWAECECDWHTKSENMKNCHLVILKKPYLNDILQGRKSVESRFTRTKRYYFGRVRPGDRLFLKFSSGPVCATAIVSKVKSFKDLTPDRICRIEHQYNCDIKGSSEYWQSKMSCRFGLLVWLRDVERIEPRRIDKKDWRAWVVLTEKENFGLIGYSASKTLHKPCRAGIF